MKLVRIIELVRSPRRTTIGRFLVALLVLGVLDAIPLVVDKEPAHTWVERVPGFWTVFGLLGCLLLILLSKRLGHLGVMTREDYYDD